MKVLVLSPHPDDESIGCSGTLRQHALAGDRVEVVFLTSGEAGGHGRSPIETRKLREREAAHAAKILGITEIEFWREPDGRLKATPAVVERMREKLSRFKPDVVYVTHDDEQPPDHRAAAKLLKLALRNGKLQPDVLMYEVWTPLRRMDHIVDISKQMSTKLRAIRAHKSQNDVVGFDEAFRGFARYRGEMHSWPGGDYAEVFARMKP